MVSSPGADEMESNVSALMKDQYLWKEQDRRNMRNRKKVKHPGRLTQPGGNLVGTPEEDAIALPGSAVDCHCPGRT